MPLSTNSIIHYTKSLKNLYNILEIGFSIKYCQEKFSFGDDVSELRFAYPMVCFCDIALSEVKKHLNSYGHYGIGLKKEWAVQKGLNPVLYLEKNSSLTTSILKQARKILEIEGDVDENTQTIEIKKNWKQELLTTCSYMKNYEGSIKIKGKENPNYRFYNEREWRYVPIARELGGNQRAIMIDTYSANKEKFNNEVGKIKLEFDISKDISYIIVKNENDIHRILNFISKKFRTKLPATDIEILMTKILTTKQIINDF